MDARSSFSSLEAVLVMLVQVIKSYFERASMIVEKQTLKYPQRLIAKENITVSMELKIQKTNCLVLDSV